MNLYIPYTPYHVLLSFAIAASKPHEEHVLILGESNSGNRGAVNLLRGVFPSVHIVSHFLEQTSTMSNIKKFFVKKRNVRRVSSLFDALPLVRNFYYFCDSHVVTTFSAYLAAEKNRDVRFFFVEDGAGTYAVSRRRPKKMHEKIADRLFYGTWHKETTVPGNFMNSMGVWALFPEKLPSVFDGRKKYAVPREPLLSRFDKDAFISQYGRGEHPVKISSLVAVDFEKYTENRSYLDLVASYIGRAKSTGGVTALKLHPSDRRAPAFFTGVDEGNIPRLPSQLPIEVFYLFYQDSLKYVVGGLSTSLLTAKWLLPDIEIVSVFPECIVQKTRFAGEILRLFSSCGITVQILADTSFERKRRRKSEIPME